MGQRVGSGQLSESEPVRDERALKVAPGAVVYTTAASWAVPQQGYYRSLYYVSAEVDWHTTQPSGDLGPTIGKVTIAPNSTADFAAIYPYQGSGWAGCYV